MPVSTVKFSTEVFDFAILTLTGSSLFGLNRPNSSSHASNLSASEPHFAHFRTVLLWKPSNLVVRDIKTLFAALGFLI